MDFYKWKWKANLRLTQCKKLAKLAKLEIQYRLMKKEERDGGIHHLLTMPLKDWKHVDAEREYLQEHGLLPVAEVEEEPEPEKEPGLLRETNIQILMMRIVTAGDVSYIPTMMKEYTDRIMLAISRVDQDYETTEHRVELSVEERFCPFELDGIRWLWDREDGALRIIPAFDASVRKELNEHFALLDNCVLAVEKHYAEEQLSDKCRSYAFQSDETAYYWSMHDYTVHTVFHEQPKHFLANKQEVIANQEYLGIYCCSYLADQ